MVNYVCIYVLNNITIFVQLLLTDTVCIYNINKHNDFNIERYSIALQVLLNILSAPPHIQGRCVNQFFVVRTVPCASFHGLKFAITTLQ